MICYFDNSATTRPTEHVVEQMSRCMLEGYYNPSALYAPAVTAEKQMTRCREVIAQQMHADPSKVIFTSGGTEADNLAIFGTMSHVRGGRVLYSAGEHPAVAAACESLKGSFDVQQIPYTAQGIVRLDALEELMTPDTRLICVMQVNNETGAVMPIQEIAAMRNRLCPEAILHVDGVQGFMRLPFDMKALGVDSYALSGHKIHAPKGVGALVTGSRVRLSPRNIGGGQEKTMRSGTENTPGITGLMTAVLDFPVQNHMQSIKMKLYEKLQEIAGEELYVNGPSPDSPIAAPHILNCSLVPVRSETMLYALEGDNIYVANGSACSSRKQKLSPVLSAMNIPRRQAESAIRFSFSPYTTEEEIDFAADCIKRHYDLLKRFERR